MAMPMFNGTIDSELTCALGSTQVNLRNPDNLLGAASENEDWE